MKISCETCVFFKDFNKQHHNNNGISGYVVGQCRRKAPSLGESSEGTPRTMWPLVRNTDHCGDHTTLEN